MNALGYILPPQVVYQSVILKSDNSLPKEPTAICLDDNSFHPARHIFFFFSNELILCILYDNGTDIFPLHLPKEEIELNLGSCLKAALPSSSLGQDSGSGSFIPGVAHTSKKHLSLVCLMLCFLFPLSSRR